MNHAARVPGGVLCAGSMVVDVAKVIDRYPPPEQLAMIDQVSVSTGGSALNMAVDLRLLGAAFPIRLLGAVGDDENADLILAECLRRNIGTSGVHRLPGVATSFTDAMVERADGRRTFFHHIGANALFDASAVDFALSPARILHAGAPGIHPLMDTPTAHGNGWTDLLQRAHVAGLHTNLELVSLDPARVAEVAVPCLSYLDSIVINELEAAALLGVDAPTAGADVPVDWPALESMAHGLIARGVSTLAVVHFPGGCVAAADDKQTWRQGSVQLIREQIRSTTGAGDAFAAGVILGIHERWPVERCLRLGVASAACCVRSPKTSEGIPDAESCLTEADHAGYHPTATRLPRPRSGRPSLG